MPVRTLGRPRLLVGAAAFLITLVTLSVVVELRRNALDELDRGLGDDFQSWTAQNPVAYDVLHAIEVAFGTMPLTILTVVVTLALLWRRHVRAALWTAGVMIAASLTTYLLKNSVERDRPVWDDPVHSLDSFSFPSGHSSGIASAMGVATVLTLLFVRRRSVRRALFWVWGLLVVLVGLDRIFLGVHNFSDVIAGYAVGAQQGYIYVRGEYSLAIERLHRAIRQTERERILGGRVLESGFQFRIDIRIGAGAFVCGEETALIASIEGKRGQPRQRPPYPPEFGLWGAPTLINNVETFANIPPILERGGDDQELGQEGG